MLKYTFSESQFPATAAAAAPNRHFHFITCAKEEVMVSRLSVYLSVWCLSLDYSKF